ncbi:MAG: hypothetical protein JSV68_14260 [Anaerolineaceae bacterium]|nr:MAG: hypothetical protein JSV68_14260 [Anaerolineaceae bacterium]
MTAFQRLATRAGLLRLDRAATGQPIVALLQVDERNTKRAAHEEWAYRTYVTSLNLSSNGLPRPDRTGQPGEQRVTVHRDDALVLFNIVVSIEWDADKGYLHMVEDAFRKASDMLYDVTDGQMAFGKVSIYDNGKHWADADFQISTKNTVRPYAFISGITSDDTAHSIRVGRFWNGDSGSQGHWDEPTGYRTLVHEFGHYALNLHDEYFVRTVDGQGHFTGEAPAACTGLEVIDNDREAVNASMMYYQYNASELAGNDRWNVNCQYTEQGRIHGESDWATVVRHYMDNSDRPRWELNTPSSRGSIMAGPATFPTYLLPFPKIDVKDFGQGGAPRQLTVYDPSGAPLPNALVALYTTPDAYTIAIDQGLTGQQGNLTVYGAAEKDTIQVASFNGAYAGATTVDKRLAYELTLSSTSANRLRIGSDNNTPYLSLVPGSEGDSLFMEVQGALAGSLPLNAIVIPGQGGGDPQSTSLAYSPAKGAYSGQVSFAGVGLGSGEVRVSGVTGGQWISINSNYNLMQVENRKRNELASEDGNLQLFVGANSLFSSADAYAVVLPTGYVPGPLPEEKQILGNAYEVRLSGATTGLKKPGVLRMHFHPEVVGKVTELAIYRWDPANKVWRQVGGAQNEIDDAVTAPVKKFGIYALMGKRIISDTELFFPVLFRP